MKFFLLLFAFLLQCLSYGTVKSDRYHFKFELLPSWQLNELVPQKSYALIHPEKVATFNVKAFYFKEAVTANALQQMRVASHYDGWVRLFSRDAHREELIQANVRDACRSVFSKHIMDSDFKLKEYITAEFCFVNGNNGYVITFETYKINFAMFKRELELFLNGFYVGDEPIVFEDDGIVNFFQYWTMIGQNAANMKSLSLDDALLNKILTKNWEIEISPQSLVSRPLFLMNKIIFSTDTSLYCLNSETGQLVWSYDISGILPQSLMVSEGLLFYVDQQTKEVVAVVIDSGTVLYRIRFEKTPFHLVADKKSFFFYRRRDP